MNAKYFSVNYENPGVFEKFKGEAEIAANEEMLSAVEQQMTDVFRVELLPSGELQVRKMLVEATTENEGEEDEEEVLGIADWELIA